MSGKKSQSQSLINSHNINSHDINNENPALYFNNIKQEVYDEINNLEHPLKFKIIFSLEFNTALAFQQIQVFHHSSLEIIRSMNDFNNAYTRIYDNLTKFIDEYQQKGSGHVFTEITEVEIRAFRMRGFRGSSYIPTPFKSSNVVNIKNKDNKCFLWSVFAKLHPAKDHCERVAKYTPYEDELNMKDIKYPVTKHDLVRFEKQNPDYAIYVWYLSDKKDKFSLRPMFTSQYKNEEGNKTIIDLLYLDNGETTHYCLIKDLNSYLYSKSNNKGFVCRNCLHMASTQQALDNHKIRCLSNIACVTKMPEKEKGKNILKFKNYQYKSRLPVAIYADFEALNKKIQTAQPDPKKSYTNKIFKQEPISYGMYIHSDYQNLYPQDDYHSYVGLNGADCVNIFVQEIIEAYKHISKKLDYYKKSKAKLTIKQEKEFQEATHCYMCRKEFSDAICKLRDGILRKSKISVTQFQDPFKIREHNHLNGKYRGAACQSCNTKEGRDTKRIPVFIHNGSKYDFHFLVQEIVKYANKYEKVEVLPKTKEDYISISIGNSNRKLIFLDSYRFLNASLDNISKGLKDEDFKILKKHFTEEQFETLKYKSEKERSFKGIFPYEYFDSLERLSETLPSFAKMENGSKEKVSLWYSTLTDEDITKEQQDHVKSIWNTFNCKTFKDYHDIYLKMDVLILADAMETFREFFLEHHEIDPAYCYSAPGLTWQCGLKYQGAKFLTFKENKIQRCIHSRVELEKYLRGDPEGQILSCGLQHSVELINKKMSQMKPIQLELLTDKNMLLMFEAQKRGGFSGVLGTRYVKANNKYFKDYNKNKPSNHLLYLDANNLYGWAMSQPLPIGDFKWERLGAFRDEAKPLDADGTSFLEGFDYYKNCPKGRGCIIECDLQYTAKAKINTRRFPLAPEHLKVKENDLSDLQLNYLQVENKTVGKTEKLILNLHNKTRYVIHHELLKYYESLGLKVTKVHKIISFKEEKWLQPYIDFNTHQRTLSKSDFEKDLWKLMNNSFYGKTCEDIRNRMKIECKTEEEIEKYINKPSFKDAEKLQDSLYVVMNNITSVTFNKPIYTGVCILDYSKLLMYKFYYEIINVTWPKNEIVLYDTDSFFLNIYTNDVYEDMKPIKDHFDTSDYPRDHYLHSNDNKKVIGKFKDELKGNCMSEIVALRSKAYSYLSNECSSEKENKKLKGISRNVVKKQITHQDYKDAILNNYKKVNYNKMYTINSINHEMFVQERNKKSISPYDDKRYILPDGIKTLPHCDPFSKIIFGMVDSLI